MNFENEEIEFKSQFTDEIYKEVIAFANTAGGFIYVGIDDNGNALGIENIDDEYNRITNGIRDAIMPDVTMFVHYTIQDNKVIRIAVNEGTNKPYYLKSKGIKPSGVFVRQGASSVLASFDQIRKMIKESDGDNFEEIRSLEQQLTFSVAKSAFEKYGVEFSEEKFLALGIKNRDIFTNLALLLSDQCKHTTKIAVFNDVSCTEFRDSKEFSGSIFSQFENCINYLSLCNKTVSTIHGIVRNDKPDYPPEAIREALLNALVHRDYSYSGSIIINVNDDKIEFISLGGLLPGLTESDILLGISQPRNKNLAEIFHRLRLIECYGTGIRRIYRLYENCAVQPKIVVSNNAFKIILPNMNAVNQSKAISGQMETVLEFISAHGFATNSDIEKLLNVKQTRVYNLMREMTQLGLIIQEGKGKSKIYRR